MNLQNAIIKQYKENYPNDKLKEISQKTNIQITRVFRILNGAEMKLSEYESFNHAIGSHYQADELVILAKKSLNHISKKRRESLIKHFNQIIKLSELQSSLFLNHQSKVL